MIISNSVDEYVDDLRWVVTLNNSSQIYESQRFTWLNLKQYVRENGLRIDKLRLEFRSHVEHILPEFASGYFFIKGAIGQFGNERTFHQYIVGVWEGGPDVKITKFITPELIIESEEKRDLEKCQECLIKNI
jgi:hypothetical protein